MSTNGVNTSEDVGMADNDGDKIVTMMDVLQEQQEFEEDANAVLGASDEKNCTYAKGYIKRQAIYACLTCCSEAKIDPTKRAGVCLACSLMCHENHDLVELYTKRNFRCDCGNPKFNSHPCQFTPNKTDFNDENCYNQNFSGVYCVCHRPYPDPESTVEDEMIQCIICEDWLHASHLEATVPPNDQYSEMICKACMEKNEFLHDYSDIAVNTDSVDVDVVTINPSTENDTVLNGNLNIEEHINDTETDQTQITNESNGNLNTEEHINGSEMDQTQIASENNDNLYTERHLNGSETNQPEIVNEKSTTNNIDAEMPENKTDKCETLGNTDSMSDNTDIELPNQNINGDSLYVMDKPENKEEEPIETNSTEDQKTDDIGKMDTFRQSDCLSSIEQKELDVEPSDKINANTTESGDNSKKADDTQPTQQNGNVETNNSSVVNKQEKPVTDEITLESSTNDMKDEKDINSQVTESNEEKANDKTAQSTTVDENKQNVDKEENDKINTETEADNSTANFVQNAENTSQDTETEYKPENANPNEEKQNAPETVNKSEDIDNSNTLIVKDKTEETTLEADTTDVTESTTNGEKNIADHDMVTDDYDNSTKNDITDDTGNDSENKTDDVANNIEMSDIANKSECTDIVNKTSTGGKTNVEVTKRKLSIETTEEISFKKPKLDETKKCTRPQGVKKTYKGATFWPLNFRQALCTCNECIAMYKDLSVLFLIDLEDTVIAYENLGKERINEGPASQYEKGLQALSSLDRVQQINALTEYNKMRDKLLDFLKSFKDRKEIVKEEDIKAFFAGMKPRREPDGVYFCQ